MESYNKRNLSPSYQVIRTMTFEDKDIRWIQRFSNYKKALAQLQKFVDKGDLSDLEKQGLI